MFATSKYPHQSICYFLSFMCFLVLLLVQVFFSSSFFSLLIIQPFIMRLLLVSLISRSFIALYTLNIVFDNLIDLYFQSNGYFVLISARSRLTFTTGVTSSPSRNVSRTLNGATKSQKMEMKLVYPVPDGDTSPKETCVSVSDVKDSEFFT